MIFFFLQFVYNKDTIDDISNKLQNKISNIDELFKKLEVIKTRLKFIIPTVSKKSMQSLEEKPVSLSSINSSRTDEYNSLMKPFRLFSSNNTIPESFPPCIIGKGFAPIFTFKTPTDSVASQILISPTPSSKCVPRQIRFDFYYHNKFMKKSSVIDFPNGCSAQLLFDLETVVVFDKVEANIIQNWGEPEKTCLPMFKILGPRQ